MAGKPQPIRVIWAFLALAALAGCAQQAADPAPKLVAVASTGPTTVEVTFSEAVEAGATTAANYAITPSLAVTQAVLDAQKTKVTLTTAPQSAVQYTLKVAGVQDAKGNPIDPAADSKTFTGTAPAAGDSDGDGLLDADEASGWEVQVRQGDGSFAKRAVTSDPAKPDTDGDGLNDKEERSNFTDPRSSDTDQDGLADFDELKKWASSPADVDSDGDAKGNSSLFDGNEIKLHGTSPTLADTDGDKISDYDEIIVRGGVYNPLIANVPQLELSLEGTTDLSVNVKLTSNNTVVSTKSASLSQGTSTSTSSTDSQTRRVEGSVSATVGAELSAGTDGVGTTLSASVTVSAGFSNENTRSYTQDSSRSSQQTREEALSEGSESGKTIDDGRVGVGLRVKNAGDVSFKLEDLVITALFRDPADPTKFKTITSLTPAIPAGGVTLASGSQTGVLDARNVAIPADQALEIMAHPNNLFFQFSTYNLTDQEGRNFEFLKEVTLAQTALVVIDYGNGHVSRARVATNVERQGGKIVGVSMKKVLDDILELPFATQAKPDGTRVLTSLFDKQAGANVARNSQQRALWAVVGSSNLSIPAGTHFEDILLKPGTEIHLLYVQDRDDDGLFASEEYFYGTRDDVADSDGDGLKDGLEVKQGWTVAVVGKASRKVFPNPTVADFDNDSLADAQEKLKGTDPFKADTDSDTTADDKDPAPLDPSVTGNRPPLIDSFSASISGFVATVTASVSDPDANLSKVEIDWGDGTAKTTLTSNFAAINTTHKYGAAGTYTVRLTATDASGVSVSQQGNVQASIPRDGLLGEYLFSNSASDTSGNNKNGSISSVACVQPAANRNGLASKAYEFNNGSGAGCGDSNGVYGLVSTANLGQGGSFSYSVWVRPLTNNDQWILGQNNGNGSQPWAALVVGNPNALGGTSGRVSFVLTGSGPTLTVADSASVSTSAWAHYVVTVSSSGGQTTVKLYRNGAQVATVSANGSYANPSSANNFLMGNAALNNTSAVFRGLMDDVRVYNRALSDGEIQALYSDTGN
ncbi:Protease 1 [Calidithermus terrae]|uniref:Protease 1 n=1 Tax=Calidithermus terrae TaxID=1408545 RepID=A0A399EJ30_9DEIN|nr:LamG-like jellyroll fold domain-containing protein [Calidithermus terrae]RIH84125.1 Protease 1 [Calidithermus terrae]